MKTQITMKMPPFLFSMLTTVALFGLCHQVSAIEGPPERMTYQGFIVDGNGEALGKDAPENYEVLFRIYTAQSEGLLKWSEQQTVTVDKGYFSVLLGEGTEVNGESRPALSTVFSGTDASERFIAISVKGIGAGGSDADILPRLQLVSSPFAYLAANVSADSISSASIANNTIASADVLDNSISGADIQNESITYQDLAPNSVYASEIAANAVGTSEVQDNSLTANDLAANSVGSSELAANSVYASEIAANAVGTSEVQDNSLTASDLAANSVGASEIAANAVGNSELSASLTLTGSLGINQSFSDSTLVVKADSGDNYIFYTQTAAGGGNSYITTAGNMWINGTFSQSSDRTLKEDVELLDKNLDAALLLQPTRYKMISDPESRAQIGFIAQDVLEVCPELVSTNFHDQTLSLNYSGFGVIAIGAIQELNQKVETLEEEKSVLLQRLEALESRVLSLEQ